MNIGINTRLLLKDKTEGIGRFIEESVKELVLLRPHDTFYFFFDRPFSPEFIFEKNVIPIVVSPPARHPILWSFWFDVMIPLYCKKHKIDVFFSPEMYVSLTMKIPQISVVHDINFVHNPELVPGWQGNYIRKRVGRYIQKSEKVFTVSLFCASDISKTLAVDPSKIDVCYNGVNHTFGKKNDKSPVNYPFFLVFGAINPRKNIVNILKAFDVYKSQSKTLDRLVFIGEKMLWNSEMEHTFQHMEHQSDVVFLGRKSDEEVCLYFNHAKALLYASLFEGFGLPIIEAQKSGCPVITSNVSCMPEIAGNGALFVTPVNVIEIVEAMKTVQHKTQRDDLIAKGFINALRFNWKEVALKINKEIETILC